MKEIIFVTLAINQTTFFSRVGDRVKEEGYNAYYLCFDEESYAYLNAGKYNAYNVFAEMDKGCDSISLSSLELCGADDFALFFNHEKAYYNIYDEGRQLSKFEKYFVAVSGIIKHKILTGQTKSHNVVLVQEFGGFISVAAAFYSAKLCGIDNVFVEPSFYKGRVFFQKNTYKAIQISSSGGVVSSEFRDYLNETVRNKKTVIPDKDKKQYRSAVAKILDLGNIKRFFQKLVFKYIFRKQQEFQYVWLHTMRHLSMAINSFRIKGRYCDDLSKNYVYFPLHVPNDASLTIRSPEYFDQIKLISLISQSMPEGCLLYIKEHPALTGAFKYRSLVRLLCSHDNIHILRSSLNNYDVVKNSQAVITVNSKAGAEALLVNKPVIVLGDAFYSSSPDVLRCHSVAELTEALRSAVQDGSFVPDSNRVYSYFRDVWNASWEGELYNNTPDNVSAFAKSLITYLGDKKELCRR